MAEKPTQTLSDQVLTLMRCPVTRSQVRLDGDVLVAELPEGAGLRYPIKEAIPVLLAEEAIFPKGIDSMDAFKAKYPDAIHAGLDS
ncbi:MAG: hypothetical protein AAGI37_02565 [Planctomycetota bacterium]